MLVIECGITVFTLHILEVHTQGAMTPIFELGRDFCTLHLSRKFHHPMFTGSEVTALTNKQADAAENIQRSSLRYDVG